MMRRIETIATVSEEGVMTIRAAVNMVPGTHTVIVEIDEDIPAPAAEDWSTFIHKTAGAWSGEFARSPQGSYEERETF